MTSASPGHTPYADAIVSLLWGCLTITMYLLWLGVPHQWLTTESWRMKLYQSHTCIRTHTHTHIETHTHTCMHPFFSVSVYVHVCVHACMHRCMCVCMCVSMCVHVCVHVCVRACAHVCMHTGTCVCSFYSAFARL